MTVYGLYMRDLDAGDLAWFAQRLKRRSFRGATSTMGVYQDRKYTRSHTGTGARRLLTLALILFCVPVPAAPAANEHYQVLVIHSFRHSAPVNADWYRGIARSFERASDVAIDIDVETLDLGRERDESYYKGLARILRRKHADLRPQLIITTYTPALRFLLDYGEDIFPGIPIVFLGADSQFVATRKLPPNITGVTTYIDIAGTLKLALRLHPATRRVAVIVGSGPVDAAFESSARRALQPFEGNVEFRWLKGVPIDELTSVVQQLPPDSVILYLVEFQDRKGRSYVPASLVEVLSKVANAPIYGLWDTLIGRGVVGGCMIAIEDDGFVAGQMALRILRGEPPVAIPIVVRKANPVIVDGRELARWNIGEDRLPTGTQIRHRQPSLWEQYRTQITTIVAIIIAQAFMIIALVLNRQRLRAAQTALQDEYGRRGQAEATAFRLRARLARFGRERSLGTMATTIAHEVNQPLIAIQNYAQAAQRRLESSDTTPKLLKLCEKIRKEAERAGAITQRVRALVSKGESELRPVPLYPVLQEVIGMMEAESEARGCRVACEAVGDLPPVLADALQVQLVLVNLLNNALRSVGASEASGKRIAVDVCPLNAQEVQVSVTDEGPGVPPERVADIFEPLYSSTSTGLGMGLAICRDIIDAHGGRIWYEPNPRGGAIFRFTLRTAGS